MLTTRHGVRVLAAADLEDFLALANQDPVVNVFAIHRAQTTSLEPRWLGGEMWGRFDGGRLVAACHVAANLVPIQAGPEDAVVFAERALARRRTASTIVGPQDAVLAVLERHRGAWGPPRDARWDQRHLVIDRRPPDRAGPGGPGDGSHGPRRAVPGVRGDVHRGSGRLAGDRGRLRAHRTRVVQLISRGWSFARFDRGELVFKAEVACATPDAAQIQGVWVAPPPTRRGPSLGRDGRGGRACPRSDLSHGLAVRQRVERARPPGLRARRLPGDLPVRHCHVLRKETDLDRSLPVPTAEIVVGAFLASGPATTSSRP